MNGKAILRYVTTFEVEKPKKNYKKQFQGNVLIKCYLHKCVNIMGISNQFHFFKFIYPVDSQNQMLKTFNFYLAIIL